MLHATGKFDLVDMTVLLHLNLLFYFFSVVSVFCSEGAPVQEGSKLAEVTP